MTHEPMAIAQRRSVEMDLKGKIATYGFFGILWAVLLYPVLALVS